MSEYVYAGLTSQTIDIFLADSSSTTGGGLTGLVFNTASLTAYYRKGATGTATAITLATQTVGGAWSSGGFVQIDATNMPGVYRIDLPNAMVDTAGFVTLYLRGAANLVPTALRIDCRALPVDVKQFGGSNGTFSGGRPEVNATHLAGQTVTAAAGVTFPASLASPTNITAATGVVLSAVTHTGAVIPTVTTLTNLPAITSNWLTASGIASGALSGKGNWLDTTTDRPQLSSIHGKLPTRAYLVGSDVDSGAVSSGDRAAISDTIWDDLTAEHTEAGSFGLALQSPATAAALASLVTTVGVAGAGLAAVPWNASWDAEVQSECADALNAYDPPTKTEQDTAFTEIKGAGWSSTTDTLEKIRDASGGGGGGSTVVVNPIALFAPGSTNDVMEIHQHETSSRGFLFYDVAANGARTAKDFDSFANLRWAFDLPDGTVWIETADITVADNLLTIPLADLSSDVGQFDATLWDWAGDQPEDERTVVLCSQLLVNEAVGAGDVVTA
jgi:hypothetical protein